MKYIYHVSAIGKGEHYYHGRTEATEKIISADDYRMLWESVAKGMGKNKEQVILLSVDYLGEEED